MWSSAGIPPRNLAGVPSERQRPRGCSTHSPFLLRYATWKVVERGGGQRVGLAQGEQRPREQRQGNQYKIVATFLYLCFLNPGRSFKGKRQKIYRQYFTETGSSIPTTETPFILAHVLLLAASSTYHENLARKICYPCYVCLSHVRARL